MSPRWATAGRTTEAEALTHICLLGARLHKEGLVLGLALMLLARGWMQMMDLSRVSRWMCQQIFFFLNLLREEFV